MNNEWQQRRRKAIKIIFVAVTTITFLLLCLSETARLSLFREKGNHHPDDNNNMERRRVLKRKDSSSSSGSKVVDEYFSKMSLMDKIGQMSQIDVSLLLEDDGTKLSDAKVKYYIGELGVGSVLNYVPPSLADERGNKKEKYLWDVRDYRRAVMAIQGVAKRHNRPPVIWGIDSVHGANYILGATITPQPINIAATFNDTCAYLAGKLASRDTRAAGINWLFSPLLGIATNPKWSRVYETFGEDPYTVSQMAQSMINGIQEYPDGEDRDEGITDEIPSKAAACAKHFVGYSDPRNGHDRSPSWIPVRHLYQYFAVPWKFILGRSSSSSSRTTTTAAKNNNGNDEDFFDDNLGEDDYAEKRYNNNEKNIPLTVMESYIDFDGVPNVANTKSMQYLLRQRLQYNGVVVTDYEEIYNLHKWHGITNSTVDSVTHALQRGDTIDMSMIPIDYDSFKIGIMRGFNELGTTTDPKHHGLKQSRIDRSAKRVLQLKESLNMFEEKVTMHNNINTDRFFGDRNPVDIESAYEMAHQSFVLVENRDDTLPLSKEKNHNILVTGPTSNSLVYQTGGWTGEWQGTTDIYEQWFNSTVSHTILDYLQQQTETTDAFAWNIHYSCGIDIVGRDCSWFDDDIPEDDDDDVPQSIIDVQDLISQRSNQDIDTIIVCLGEEAYAEKPGDINDLKIPSGQERLVRYIDRLLLDEERRMDTSIILVYLGGRPRVLGKALVDRVDAVLIGFLPGPSTGKAFYDILVGDVNPSGRLPMTYPLHGGDVRAGSPYFHSVSDRCTQVDDGNGPLLPHMGDTIPCAVQWPFGHGMSYTTFEYSDLTIDTDTLVYYYNEKNNKNEEDGFLMVSLTVSNTGSRDGSDTVLFYTFDRYRSVTPEYKRLRYYEKIFLPAGASTSVTMELDVGELKFIGPDDDSHYIIQDGLQFRVGIGSDTDCRDDDNDEIDDDLCSDVVTIRAKAKRKQTKKRGSSGKKEDGDFDDEEDNVYIPACEAACHIWKQSGCILHDDDSATDAVRLTADTTTAYNKISLMPSMSYCYDLCSSVSDDYDNNIYDDRVDSSSSLEQSRNGWGWNYVHCLESVFWGFQHEEENLLFFNNNGYKNHLPPKKKSKYCWKMTALCRNVFTTPRLDEYGSTCMEKGRQAKNTSAKTKYLVFGIFVISASLISCIIRYHPDTNKGDDYNSIENNGSSRDLLPAFEQRVRQVIQGVRLEQRVQQVQELGRSVKNAVTRNKANIEDHNGIVFEPVATTGDII